VHLGICVPLGTTLKLEREALAERARRDSAAVPSPSNAHFVTSLAALMCRFSSQRVAMHTTATGRKGRYRRQTECSDGPTAATDADH